MHLEDGRMGEWGLEDISTGLDFLGKHAKTGLDIYTGITDKKVPDVVYQYLPQPAPPPPPPPPPPIVLRTDTPAPAAAPSGFTPWLVGALAGGGLLLGGIVYAVTRGGGRT